MADSSPETVFRIDRRRAAWRQIGDEAVVLDLSRSVYFGLNRSAGSLWQRLVDGATRAELTDQLLADTPADTSADHFAADVDEFLAALDREGLIISADS